MSYIFFCCFRSPTSGNYYNFDIPYEEQEIVTDEERNLQPKTIQEVMNDVIVYVEVRTENDNRTAGIKEKLIEIGAKVNDRLLRFGRNNFEKNIFILIKQLRTFFFF